MKFFPIRMVGVLLLGILITSPAIADRSETCTGPEMIRALRSAVAAKPGNVEEIEIDDGLLEVKITTADKHRFKVYVDPSSGEAVRIKAKGESYKHRYLPVEALVRAIEAASSRQDGSFSEVEVKRRGSRNVVKVEMRDLSGREIDYIFDPTTNSLFRD